MSEPTAPTVPADVVARVEGVELKNLVAKVQAGGTLTPSERQTFAKLTDKYGAAAAGKPSPDLVPVSQDEGNVGEKATRNQKLARVQVVAEWMCAYKARPTIVQLAASRWGIAPRSADDLIAAAKRLLADPRQHSRQVMKTVQVRGLQSLVASRLEGKDGRDPLDAMKELAKLLGLNEPDRIDSRQEIATPDGQPLVQFFIPDNGRKLTTDQPAEEPSAAPGA